MIHSLEKMTLKPQFLAITLAVLFTLSCGVLGARITATPTEAIITKITLRYFLTVDELLARKAAYLGKNVRISGVVIGSTIQFDPQTLELSFTIANIPGDFQTIDTQGGLTAVLQNAISNPEVSRINIRFVGLKPDLLKDRAQAILAGKLGEDGIFHADEILLKCPTKYEEYYPDQVK